MKKNICIILARKNSKRIKNKNIISFNNKPLIYWTLKHSLDCKIFSKIIVSSDSGKILKIARKKSKRIILNLRPKNLSGSATSSEKAIRYIINKYKINKGDYITLLQVTSPLRKVYHIKDMWKLVKKLNLNTLHSISNKKNKTLINKTHNFFPLKINKLKKRLGKFYLNGSIYMFKTSFFLKKNKLHEKSGNYYFINNRYSLDLDDFNDLYSYKYKIIIKKS